MTLFKLDASQSWLRPGCPNGSGCPIRSWWLKWPAPTSGESTTVWCCSHLSMLVANASLSAVTGAPASISEPVGTRCAWQVLASLCAHMSTLREAVFYHCHNNHPSLLITTTLSLLDSMTSASDQFAFSRRATDCSLRHELFRSAHVPSYAGGGLRAACTKTCEHSPPTDPVSGHV